MKATDTRYKVIGLFAGLIGCIIMLLPFHAFLTVWLASLVGHYTLLRLWKEILLIILLMGLLYLLRISPKLRWRLISFKLHWFILGYLFIQLLWGVISLLNHAVTAKALGFAWIVNLRFLAFYLVVWAFAMHEPIMAKRWSRWVVWPLGLVIIFGLLQYFVLPYDFLRHFGYNEQTIYPYETINHNVHHLRMMSTLRGANPLGSYLILALTLVASLWYRSKKWWYGLIFAGGVLCLGLSFSRGAWIGTVLSLAVLAFTSFTSSRALQRVTMGLVVLVLIFGGLVFSLRNNLTFQDLLFHTDVHSSVKTSSNQGHVSALESGLKDLLHQPFGRGPGTAGPASVYNNHPPRIAENYYIQIGQETGWIGLLAFVAINVVVARALWRRRQQPLALSLLASLIGISFINLLSHAWTDDTLSYLWWGLAGLAVASDLNGEYEPSPLKAQKA